MLLLLLACQPDRTPTWAFDPVWITPVAADILGFQSWQIYGEPWRDNPDARFYVCGVVVQLDGTPTACDDCIAAWETTATVVETDCPDAIASDPLFTSVVAVGIGEASPDAEAPYPGSSAIGWIDYGFGWEEHGWAWPAALDEGGSGTVPWDGTEPYQLWPRSIWPLDATAGTTTPASRSAP